MHTSLPSKIVYGENTDPKENKYAYESTVPFKKKVHFFPW